MFSFPVAANGTPLQIKGCTGDALQKAAQRGDGFLSWRQHGPQIFLRRNQFGLFLFGFVLDNFQFRFDFRSRRFVINGFLQGRHGRAGFAKETAATIATLTAVIVIAVIVISATTTITTAPIPASTHKSAHSGGIRLAASIQNGADFRLNGIPFGIVGDFKIGLRAFQESLFHFGRIEISATLGQDRICSQNKHNRAPAGYQSFLQYILHKLYFDLG
jgi:hypothetical protein